ncbi:MAG: T9SS type A sorting domain-containing protein [Bacteroidales bacterium]|nr:T9SS type A sorting domain-containing protein [Bacteroidales bacterium]
MKVKKLSCKGLGMTLLLMLLVCNLLYAQQPSEEKCGDKREKHTLASPVFEPLTDENVYFSNGSIITHPGQGANGADLSYSWDDNIWGFNFNKDESYSLATRVVINDPNMAIDSVRIYGYQEYSTTTSTFTHGYLRIWDARPMDGGKIIWGSHSANIMTNTYWTGVYRGTSLSSTDRPIMAITLSTEGLVFQNPGTYWFDFSTEGTLSSGPWCPPIKAGSDLQYNSGWEVEAHTFPIDVFAEPTCDYISFLSASLDGTSATINFISENNRANIRYGIKGAGLDEATYVNNVSSPFVINNLEPFNVYEVYIQSICPNGELGFWQKLTDLNIRCGGTSCGVIFNLSDSYSDGWNGAKIHVYENDQLLQTMTISSGRSFIDTLLFCEGSKVNVVFERGSYPNECSLSILDGQTNSLLYGFSSGNAPAAGTIYSFVKGCGTCSPATSLTASDITSHSISLDWTDNNPVPGGWIVEYGEPGFSIGSGTEVVCSQKPVVIDNLEEARPYSFYVRKECANNSGLVFSNMLEASTLCNADCRYIFSLTDSRNDGWHGAKINVYENGLLRSTMTISSGGSFSDTLSFCSGSQVDIDYLKASWSSECGFSVKKELTNEVLYQFLAGNSPNTGIIHSFNNQCGSCLRPLSANVARVENTNCLLSISPASPGASTNYLIEYGEKGFVSGSGTFIEAHGSNGLITGLSSGTRYEAYISAVCGDGMRSLVLGPISFSTPGLNSCNTIFNLVDSWGDGWDDNALQIYQDGELVKTLTFSNGSSLTDTMQFPNNSFVELKFINSAWSSECGLTVINGASGETMFSFLPKADPPTGIVYSFTGSCSDCGSVDNFRVSQVGSNLIAVEWDGGTGGFNYQLYCLESGVKIGQGTPVTTTNNHYEFTQLKRSTYYDVYLRKMCSTTAGSEWYSLGHLKTSCLNTYQVTDAGGIFCPDYNNAAVKLSKSDSEIRYTLYLDGAATTIALQGTGAALNFTSVSATGNYTVVGVDPISGCSAPMLGSYQFEKYPELQLQAELLEAVKCYGVNDGAIAISSPANSIQYSINAGGRWQTNSVFTSLNAGTYTPAIKDTNNCVHLGEAFEIPNVAQLVVNSVVKTNLTSNTAIDGTIIISASGGSGILEYSIDNGKTWSFSNGFTSLDKGKYYVVLKDTNDCTLAYINNPVEVLSFVNVEALGLNEKIMVYPNPSTGHFTVRYNGSEEEATVTVINSLGQKIYSENADFRVNEEHVMSPEPALKPGSYLIRVETPTRGYSQLLLVK